nr:probably inactive leucine-rich repeat receptor-like protein kinase At3g28040 [Coffea arabica]
MSLEEIDFAENSLSGSLPIHICNHPLEQIKGLNLSVNQLQGSIPSELYKCRDLEHLSLSNDQFNGRIPRTLGYLDKLKDLSIGGNNFTGGIQRKLEISPIWRY